MIKIYNEIVIALRPIVDLMNENKTKWKDVIFGNLNQNNKNLNFELLQK